jgi:hypothetical protein
MSRNWSRLRRFMSAKQSRFPSGITAFLGHKVRIQPTGQILPTLMLLGRMYGSGMPVLVIALCAGILDLIGKERIRWWVLLLVLILIFQWDMFHTGEPAMVIRDFTSSPVTRPSDIVADFGRAWYAAKQRLRTPPNMSH